MERLEEVFILDPPVEGASRLTASKDGKPPILDADTFVQVSVGNKPYFLLKSKTPGAGDFPEIGERTYVKAQPIVLTVPKGLYRTRDITHEVDVSDGSHRMMGTYTDDCEALLVTVLDRPRVINQNEAEAAMEVPEIKHFCNEAGERKLLGCANPFACHHLVTTSYGQRSYLSALYDWYPVVSAMENEELLKYVRSKLGNSSAPVKMVASFLPNRTAMWTPIIKKNYAAQHQEIMSEGLDRIFQATGISFLDGPDIFVNEAKRMLICRS